MQFFEATSQQTGACGNHFLSIKELFSLCLEKKCFLICFFVKKGIYLPNTYKRVTYKVTELLISNLIWYMPLSHI